MGRRRAETTANALEIDILPQKPPKRSGTHFPAAPQSLALRGHRLHWGCALYGPSPEIYRFPRFWGQGAAGPGDKRSRSQSEFPPTEVAGVNSRTPKCGALPNACGTPGGGCKLTEDRYPEIFDVLEEIMSGHIAGDPMNENVRWTDKKLTRIRNQLAEKGYELCVNTVKRLVKMLKKILAQQAGQKEGDQPEPGSGPTDQQFQKIKRLSEDARSRGVPIISIDGKKKNRPALPGDELRTLTFGRLRE